MKNKGSEEKGQTENKEPAIIQSEEELIREEAFPSLAAYAKRKFIPRESLIFHVITHNRKSYHSLRGFYHLAIVLATFYILTHPLFYYQQHGELFNKKLYNTFNTNVLFVLLMWPAMQIWTLNAFFSPKICDFGAS